MFTVNSRSFFCLVQHLVPCCGLIPFQICDFRWTDGGTELLSCENTGPQGLRAPAKGAPLGTEHLGVGAPPGRMTLRTGAVKTQAEMLVHWASSIPPAARAGGLAPLPE